MHKTTKEKTRKIFDSDSRDDAYSPIILGDLLLENREWQAIPDIVKLSFKSLYDVIQIQGKAIREIENTLVNKLTMQDIIPYLEQNAKSKDISETLSQLTFTIDQKPSFEQVKQLVEDNLQEMELNILSKLGNPDKEIKTYDSNFPILDLKNDLILLNERFEELYKTIDLKLPLFATINEIEKINEKLSQKLNISEFNEIIEKKANQEVLIKAIENIVPLDNFISITQQKVDLNEFNSTIFSIKNSVKILSEKTTHDFRDFEKKIQNNLSEIFTKLIEVENSSSLRKSLILENKIITIENRLNDITKELTHNLESINDVILEKTNPTKIESILLQYAKKIQIYEIENKINELNFKLSEICKSNPSKIKKENIQGDKQESDFNETKLEQIYKEVKSLKENIRQITEEKLFSDNELEKKMLSQLEINRYHYDSELSKIKDQVYKLEKQVEMSNNDIQKNNLELVNNIHLIDEKFGNITSLSKDEINSKITEMKSEFKNIVQQHEIHFLNLLSQKANLIDLTTGIYNKMDLSGIKNLREITSNEAKEDQLNIIKTLVDTKADINDMDIFKNNISKQISELSNQIKLKSDIKDVCVLLDSKLSIKDFENLNHEIQKEMYGKTNKEDLLNFITEQGEINKLVLFDNCVGRWSSKFNEFINGHLIVWDVQQINNSPENYIWENSSPYLIINHPGLYEISIGIYTKSNPTAKLNINGESIANIQSLKRFYKIAIMK